MKVKALMQMRSNPSITLDTKLHPIAVESSLAGDFGLSIGAISARVGEIPVRFAVPFLKRRGALPTVASFGGFTIRLKPIEARIGTDGIKVHGTLGTKGIEAHVESQIACKTDMEVKGQVGGRIGTVTLHLGSDEEFTEFE